MLWVLRGRVRVAIVGLLLMCALGAAALTPSRAIGVDRGIVDNRLETLWPVDLETVPALVEEIGSGRLGARWSRVLVHWTRLQPSAPGVIGAGDARW